MLDILLHFTYHIKFLIFPVLYYVFKVEKGETSEVVREELTQNNEENECKAALLLP